MTIVIRRRGFLNLPAHFFHILNELVSSEESTERELPVALILAHCKLFDLLEISFHIKQILSTFCLPNEFIIEKYRYN